MSIVLAPALILGAVAIAIAALLFVRRNAPDGGYFHDSDRAAGVFGVLATGLFVLLGFIVFLSYASYDRARSGATLEAQLVAQQYQTAQFLPPPGGPQLAAEDICYARYVVHQEWPRLRDGTTVATVNPWGIAMFRTLKSVKPDSATSDAAFAKWMDQTSDREAAKLDRLHGADSIIPTALWVVLFLSAGVIFIYMLFFADSGERAIVQALQIGTVVAVIVSTLLLIRFLGSPYQSDIGGLQPTAMKNMLQVLETDLAGVGEQAALPCDAQGESL